MQGYTRRNLDTYKELLLSELKKRGIPVVGCHCEISSGWILNEDRWALMNAVEQAKKLIRKGIKVAIVTASTDRFLRNTYFTTDKPDLLPTEAEFDKLIELTCGVPLVTLLDPDMPPREVRSYQTKWGQEYKGHKGGRPEKREQGYKKKRRLRKLEQVIRLHKQGIAICKIVRQTGVKRSTINDWITEYEGVDIY